MISAPNTLIRPEFAPLSIARILWNGKFIIAAIWIVLSVVTVIVLKRMPKSYTGEALILVESPQVPANYVTTSVSMNVQDEIAAFRHRILTAENVKALAEKYSFWNVNTSAMADGRTLDEFRSQVIIKPERGWEATRSGAFRISYENPNAVTAAAVANSLAELLIGENLKTREKEARGTTEFLNTQLKEAKQRLDEIESSMIIYKQQHGGELPEQESSLLGILAQLQSKSHATDDAVVRARQNEAAIENEMAASRELASSEKSERLDASLTLPQVLGPSYAAVPAKRSEVLQAELEQLRLRYAEEHPEVRRLQAELAGAKTLEAAASNSLLSSGPPSAAGKESPAARTRTAQLQAQMEKAKRELDIAEAEQAQVARDLATYQKRIGRLPVTEQEIARLMRDYEISKTNYSSLLSKSLSAELSTNLELGQKSERVTILEPARPPLKPSKPKTTLLAVSGSLGGLILGAALAFGIGFRKGTILGEWEMPGHIPVIARLPNIREANRQMVSSRGVASASTRERIFGQF